MGSQGLKLVGGGLEGQAGLLCHCSGDVFIEALDAVQAGADSSATLGELRPTQSPNNTGNG